MSYRIAKRLILIAFALAAVAQIWVGVLWPLIGFGLLGLMLTWLVGRHDRRTRASAVSSGKR